MNLDWQNILAPVAVALAALALVIRSGIFRRRKKRPLQRGCCACTGCRKRLPTVHIEDKSDNP